MWLQSKGNNLEQSEGIISPYLFILPECDPLFVCRFPSGLRAVESQGFWGVFFMLMADAR